MEAMHRAGNGEKMQGFYALSEYKTLPKSLCVHQPLSSPNPILLGFLEASLYRHG